MLLVLSTFLILTCLEKWKQMLTMMLVVISKGKCKYFVLKSASSFDNADVSTAQQVTQAVERCKHTHTNTHIWIYLDTVSNVHLQSMWGTRFPPSCDHFHCWFSIFFMWSFNLCSLSGWWHCFIDTSTIKVCSTLGSEHKCVLSLSAFGLKLFFNVSFGIIYKLWVLWVFYMHPNFQN